MFVLLARDLLADELVREWAKRRSVANHENGDKIMEALSCAADMYRWRMDREHQPLPPVLPVDGE